MTSVTWQRATAGLAPRPLLAKTSFEEEEIMSGWLQRLRGALGMGLVWALGWAPIGALLGSALWIVLDPPVGLMSVVQINALAFGALGFVGGALFSVVLRLAEGRKRFDELTLGRFATWGAVGGFLLGGLAVFAGLWGASGFPVLGVVGAVAAATALGSVAAAGTLALARGAGGRELLGPGESTTLGRGDAPPSLDRSREPGLTPARRPPWRGRARDHR